MFLACGYGVHRNFFCAGCKNWATEEHVQGTKHLKQAKWFLESPAEAKATVVPQVTAPSQDLYQLGWIGTARGLLHFIRRGAATEPVCCRKQRKPQRFSKVSFQGTGFIQGVALRLTTCPQCKVWFTRHYNVAYPQ